MHAVHVLMYILVTEANFEVFHPPGTSRCTDGMKSVITESTEGVDLFFGFLSYGVLQKVDFSPPDFTQSVLGLGMGPPKLRILPCFRI